MGRSAFELAGIFRQHGEAYRQTRPLPLQQLRVMRAIEVCRTAALGGHAEKCSQCDFTRISYNSCRNRHCPKCQNTQRAKWLEDRQAELLPVTYFHVVFTIPEELARIAFYNKEVVYGILFRTAAETLLTIARDPKHLGAEIGFFGILHTWGQNLLHHPHVHFVVPGGGLSPDYESWIPGKPGFFLPVRVLSSLFRRLFLEALRDAFHQHKLQFFGDIAALTDRTAFAGYLEPLSKSPWVVYAKKPFGGPRQVLAYLGRYTHRVALSNHRILDVSNGQVTFRWKDYRCKGRQKARVMTLAADEFMRRFLLHTLPPGFQRIRYFGFLANRFRKEKLELCRKLLTLVTVLLTALLPQPATCQAPEAPSFRFCPRCHTGILIRIALVSRLSLARTSPGYLMTRSSAPRTGARSAFTAAPARSVFRPLQESLRCHQPQYLTDFRASFSLPPLHQADKQERIRAAAVLKSPSFPRFRTLRDIQNP